NHGHSEPGVVLHARADAPRLRPLPRVAPEDGHGSFAARGIPLLLTLAGRKILFVGGKGGVGKSTTASALALRMAEAGERVLLVSTDPAHSLGDLFDQSIGDREVELVPELFALEIDPEREIDRYLAEVKANMRR